MNTGRKHLAAWSVIAVAGAAMIGWAPSAEAAYNVSGQITCVDGLDISGVWIAAQSNSGFAAVQNLGAGNARFSKSNIGGPWTVHVGCGGTGTQWKYTPNGNVTVDSASASWTCYTPDTGRNLNFCQHT